MGFGLSYNQRDDLRGGKEVVFDSLEQSVRSWIYTVDLIYGLTDRLSLEAGLPLINVDFQSSAIPGGKTDTKFGDLTILARYYWSFGYFAAPVLVSLGAGLNLPTGGGIENPITSDRNFVSGTVDPILSGSALFSIIGPWSANANIYARPILAEDADGTKSGSFISYGAGTVYSFTLSQSSGIDLSLRASGLHRAKDKIKGQAFDQSGGDWIYITPGVTLGMFGRGIHGLQIKANLEIPVYQFANGNQLTEDWTLRIGAFYGFHLFAISGNKPPELEPID